jgi:predicted TIM-barrel fold metal-dependent hydrolase
MTDFVPNIWLDFSLTQEYFGWVGQRPRFRQVADGIDYGLQFDRIRRKILFGSDEPFFSQRLALERYLELPDWDLFLVENFLSLLQKAGLA